MPHLPIGHNRSMSTVLYFIAGIAALLSLVTIIGYAIAFLCVSIWTFLSAPKQPKLYEELDRVLASIMNSRLSDQSY